MIYIYVFVWYKIYLSPIIMTKGQKRKDKKKTTQKNKPWELKPISFLLEGEVN